ncbi:MAG: HIT family protein [Pseudomonadota bacterium]
MCLFCEIANKRVPSVIVWEDADIMAFLDIHPIREAHCQIMPKAHYETFEDVPASVMTELVAAAQRLAKRMKQVYTVDRVAFLFTGGDVPHAHAHLLPMHEKTDITSVRYILNDEPLRYGEAHLHADTDTLKRVRRQLDFSV